jgi:phage gpG-like protein
MQISITGVQATEAMLRRLSLLSLVVREWFETGEHDRIMQESFQKNFEAGGRPAWEPLAQFTVESRERLGFSGSSPILVRTGNFMDEITSMESKRSYAPGQSIAEWGIDQIRGEERVKFHAHTTGDSGGRDIPIRPVIGFQQEDQKELLNSLGKFIERNFV